MPCSATAGKRVAERDTFKMSVVAGGGVVAVVNVVDEAVATVLPAASRTVVPTEMR